MEENAPSGLTALSPETNSNQTAMDLPPVTSAAHSQVILVKRRRLGGISEMLLLPLRGYSMSGMCVNSYKIKVYIHTTHAIPMKSLMTDLAL
jgi:hypothetical protein